MKLLELSWMPSMVLGAGMTAHNVISRRATQYERYSSEAAAAAFSGLALDRHDALQAGSPFPDFLYACGDDHNAGEMDHWEPFQQHAANYIRSTYPNWASEPRSSDGAGLVTFFNGIVSHYIADENWHGMCAGCDNKGLIKLIGYSDFTCTGDLCWNAHHSTDMGGEFVAATQTDLSWFPKTEWHVPVTDLINIFNNMNATCNWGDYCPTTKPIYIRECSLAFYAGSWAISHFGHLIYPFISHEMGGYLTGTGFIDSEIGGVDDNAAWTAFMWDRWASWVLDGPPSDDELRQMLQRREEDPPFHAKRVWMNAVKSVFREHGAGPFYSADTSSGAVKIGVNEELKDIDRDFLKLLASSIVHDFIQADDKLLTSTRADELEKVLHGEVDNIVDGIVALEEKVVPSPKLAGSTSHEQFGYDFSSADVDGDGCEDVLVGSPGLSSPSHPQSGKASLFMCPSSSGPVYSLSSSMSNNAVYERFGATSKLFDINNDKEVDAIVCAPSFGGENVEAVVGNYTGRCDVFFGPLDGDASPSLILHGDAKWGLFGKTVAFGDVTGDGIPDLLVSSPQAGGAQEKDNTGVVFVFDGARDWSRDAPAEHKLVGDSAFLHFGESLEITDTGLLLVGSPHYHADWNEKYAVGRVQAWRFVDGEFEVAWTISGCDHGSVLGEAMASSRSTLALGEIGFNHTNVPYDHVVTALNQLRSGRVTVLNMEDLVDGDEKRICDIGIKFEPHDSEKKIVDKLERFPDARFGSSLAWRGHDLFVGAPGKDNGVGAVYVWNGTSLRVHKDGDEGKYSRMGQRIAISGHGKLMINAPRASLGSDSRPDGEEYGVLQFFE